MNIGSFILRDRAHYGVFQGSTVAPAAAPLIAAYTTLRDLLDAGAVALLRDPANLSAPVGIDEITFLPPIPNPRKIICVGLNYVKPYPVDGMAPPSPENILVFSKEREALVGHGSDLEPPLGAPSDSFDYEGEIAAVIGSPARHVSASDAMQHVLGYAPFNDGSVREWQKHSLYAGKNFAKSGAWGPWITTTDALAPVEDLHLTVTLNGALVQSAHGREMIFSLAEQISYLSDICTLRPGDVIATGSPDGTGGSRTPRRFLRPGDEVSLTISGVGTLTNRVAEVPPGR